MKTFKLLGLMAVLTGVAASSSAHAADTNVVIKPYPLKTCIVSGEKLGGMGSGYVTNYNGQEIKFCCEDCVKDFNKDKQGYLKKIAAAEKKAKK